MVDKAALGTSPTFAERMLAHSRDSKQRAAEKVVNIASRTADAVSPAAAPQPEHRLHLAVPQDFSSAIDLIHEASEAVRISEQRADDLEQQIRGLLNDAAEEVSRLKLEIAAKDAQIARSVEQAQASEARAHEAEAWLSRLNEAVLSSLSPLQKRKAHGVPK